MDALQNFMGGYWEFAKWMLAAMGAISLMVITVLRRRAKGIAWFILVVYVTMAYYLMASYQSLDFSLEFALGTVVVVGLVLASGFYYFFFVRSD